VKNYLIKGLHRIASTTWWPSSDRSAEGDLYNYYSKMATLSEASFCHFLSGDWEYIKLESTAIDVNHVFRQQFRAIWNIWSSEPCNILYCGSDTLMTKPTDIFGNHKHFLLFNYTDPKQHDQCEHYLNADIRYYPAEMSRDMFAGALAEVATAREWEQDQLLYNRMVWGQGLTPKQVIRPELAYQAQWLPGNDNDEILQRSNSWNGCDINNAHIIHLHGSRNAPAKLEIMKAIYNLCGIPNAPVRNIKTKTIDISHIP
jgi:hypothetical protein